MNKKILKIRSGSFLYGTNTKDSDTDYLGIYLNTKSEILGLQNSEELTENIISKADNGKNTKDAVDCKFYELRKFCRLAINGNPTVLEILFVNPENILEITKEGQELLSLKKEFISKRIYDSFMGYAFSQRRKAFEKVENIESLMKLYKYINETLKYNETHDTIISVGVSHLIKNGMELLNDGRFKCGDLIFNNILIKKLKSILRDRINKAGWRKDGILKYGMDYKFMSHNIRLMLEGMELMDTKNLVLPLSYKDLIVQIKSGQMENIKVIELMNQLENKFHGYKDNIPLPEKANFEVINNYIIKTYYNYLTENKNE